MSTIVRPSQKAIAVLSSLLVLLLVQLSFGHCQVPCGIYDDHARVSALLEDVKTIEKSLAEIDVLKGKTDIQSQQQLVRWVNNKESHAEKIITTLGSYFLTQRIDRAAKDYTERLVKHHAVIVNAMKAKQSVDPAVVKALRTSVEALQEYYPLVSK